MTPNTHRQSLEEVLDEFFFATGTPSAAAVLRACEAHPEFRQDILEFAALWTAHDAAPEPAAADVKVPAASVSLLQSYALNSLHEADRAEQAVDSGVGAAKAALAALAGAGLRRAAAAAGLGAATLLLHKILNNLIVDVPRAVLADLANHLKVTLAELQSAIPGRVAMGTHRSASQKPNEPSQETWANAVGHLAGVSDSERERLKALADKEPQS